MDKWIYAFGGGTAEGRADQIRLLGGKGAGLAQMSRLGIPVPPGFTLTTEVCHLYHERGERYPEGLDAEFEAQLATLEALLGRGFGSQEDPLLLSVRSGAPISMPGMMDTILNLGLNDEIVEAQLGAGWDPRFLRDCYRRLIGMYGNVVMGVPHRGFEEILGEVRAAEGATIDAEISAEGLERVIRRSLDYIAGQGSPFPQDPRDQLWGAVSAVFRSWNVKRAREYRRLHGISEDLGTGVNVQAMVFGNRGPDCATGVAFTRDPSTGEKTIYGEYLVNAQGEDVVAGIRTPKQILDPEGGLAADFPQAFRQLVEVCATLEAERREMQDVEFTIEAGKLYMLQTRAGKRSGPSAVRIAAEMVEEGLIDRSTALLRVDGTHVAQMLAPEFEASERQAAIERGALLARGLAAGPGAASGRIALTADRAAEMAAGGPVLLVRDETSPEDIVGMHASAGILTSRGGMTSHAAVVARGLGKPCIVGAGELVVDEEAGELRVAGRVFREGDVLSIDGSTGEILDGHLAPHPSEVLQILMGSADASPHGPSSAAFLELLEWADGERRLGVRANADTPHDAEVAVALGARGIGLCRTEHMFFDESRIAWIRQVILARRDEDRTRALAALLPEQRSDFEGILEAMQGMPVTIRLLDPPLHEFLPRETTAIEHLAQQMELSAAQVRETVETLEEANPMLGHRGCRLGLTHPEIYEMQVEAIAQATAWLRGRRIDARPEIMVPLVGTEEEMRRLRVMVQGVLDRVAASEAIELDIPIGTMIEVPRAALVADRIARHADFFSFGTNDLTQMTFGYSRDDIGRFLPAYVNERVLPSDPFAELDQTGVGQLVELACERGRAERSGLKLGICGEHGGDPSSIDFFEGCGLDYVSCSPYRVPVARVAAAQASLRRRGRDAGSGD
jgi:pyruvate,orthophosphate dikinase